MTARPTWLRFRFALAICVALGGLAACSSSSKSSPPSGSSTIAPTVTGGGVTTTTRPRPPGPAATISTELTGGKGAFLGEGTPPDLQRDGYVQREYTAAGTATSYKAAGALTRDGRWRFTPDATAPYRTRVIVRAPADAAKFSGTVVVEWLNVSGGVDANPEWTSTAEE